LRVDSASPADRIGYSRLTSAGGAHDREIPGLGLHLVWLEPGGFERAESTRGGRTRPAARVRLAEGFWIGRTEVTQAQWQAVMDANPSQFKGGERPVERVTWDEAMEFCRRLTETERTAGRLPAGAVYTLPTETQWEYACRAGTMTPSASATQMRATSWLHNEHNHQTQMVGKLAENAWGIADLVGNVAEWCLDEDPEVPQQRIARGGSYDTSLLDTEIFSLADAIHFEARNPSVGFRIVLINTVRD
jgi:formylglycine-generating enzyme required for sulfatase activity